MNSSRSRKESVENYVFSAGVSFKKGRRANYAGACLLIALPSLKPARYWRPQEEE